MDRTLEQLEDEVLHLPKESRARLMARLLGSFHGTGGVLDQDIARSWVEEAERRDEEMTSGAEEGIPAEKVFAKIRVSSYPDSPNR